MVETRKFTPEQAKAEAEELIKQWQAAGEMYFLRGKEDKPIIDALVRDIAANLQMDPTVIQENQRITMHALDFRNRPQTIDVVVREIEGDEVIVELPSEYTEKFRKFSLITGINDEMGPDAGWLTFSS